MASYESQVSTLRDLLSVLFKRKTQILLFFTATVCAVAVGTFLTKPTYEAASQILVKMGRENLYVPTVPAGGSVSPIITVDRQEQINSEIEILNSRYLAEEVVKALGPKTIYPNLDSKGGLLRRLFSNVKARQSPVQSAVLLLRKDLTVEGIKKSNVIEVRFKNRSPVMAAKVLNALVERYLDRHLQVHKAGESHKFFEEQAAILKRKLQDAEAALEAFKKVNDIRSLEEERTILLRSEADLRGGINDTLSRISETENRIGQLRRQLAATPETIPQDTQTEHSPYVINTLQAHLVELEIKEKELLGKYTEQNRLVQNVREEIRIVREKLAEVETKRQRQQPSA